MIDKKQVIVYSVVFDDEETHAKSAAEAISHRLFNEDGIIEWDFRVKTEESMSADITYEDMEAE